MKLDEINKGGVKSPACQQNFQGNSAESMYDTRHYFMELQTISAF
jgi:hypothetical protein